MNCLSYALPLWHKYGGHLQLRKSKELDVAHVVWISPEGKMLHYAPKAPRKKNWRHLFLLCTGFDGVVRTADDIDPKPMRLRGLLLSAYIFALVVTWFCIKELFIRLVGTINMKQVLIAIDEALKCKETGEEKTIVFGLTGTGYFDLVAYQKFNDHEMTDIIPTDEQLAASIAKLPKVSE